MKNITTTQLAIATIVTTLIAAGAYAAIQGSNNTVQVTQPSTNLQATYPATSLQPTIKGTDLQGSK